MCWLFSLLLEQGARAYTTKIVRYSASFYDRWFDSRVLSVLDSGAKEPGFISQPRRQRVTVLGKLFTPIVLLLKLVAALLRVARETADLAYRRVYDSGHLQADCQEMVSAPEPYARQSSMGYLYVFLLQSPDCWASLYMPASHILARLNDEECVGDNSITWSDINARLQSTHSI